MESAELTVGIADIKIGKAPQTIKTNLGSCIAVCLYDAEKKIGGMLHLMLAHSKCASEKTSLKKEKYADTGIAEMLSRLKKTYGLDANKFTAKIFGGAKVLKTVMHNIGEENAVAVREILKECGIKITASQVGGEKGYRVFFDLETGKVICQIFGEEVKEY